ncbi:MAG TPA: hypothetical protein VK509_12180 [Polyangiales bacterium]|nr:hypothetical protein [Polyangiales bacterium]
MHRRVSKSRLTLAVLVLCVATAATAAATSFKVFSPKVVERETGKTYPQHAAAFWKWALSQPTPTNPLADATGENCDVGQSGRNWYLAGGFAGETIVRSCTVPRGKNLVLPVFNFIAAAFPTDPPEQREVGYLRESVSIAEEANVELEIDGKPVKLKGFYEESKVFHVTLPEDNIFGLTGSDREFSPAVDAGYYVAIAPLPRGLHTIHSYGELDGSAVDVTWEIDVR